MKKLRIFLFVCSFILVVPLAYVKGRQDVWIAEFKTYQGNMLTLTQWHTNQAPELREFVKARYYYLANKTPKSWVGEPYDYGSVSTNTSYLSIGKGPTSAPEEYHQFLMRTPPVRWP